VAEILALVGLRDIAVREEACSAAGAPECVWIADFAPPE
jgi:hypothetical protein